jgi:hypothetical protein
VLERNLNRIVISAALVFASKALLPVVKDTVRPMVSDLSRQMKQK